ncbi:MAG: bifunctional (p)ppGpp synthase/hydrolase [Nitratiruptor sp.]|nr:bifunctional (p)ppGpp synthase/hydrolase [Nitratiruptor sp.]NPA84167.1 bifunctional (p)ppGpp synthetase/guanosine-3',5'-bis(diphosphate) 3'-pyrophosphohydrolase [Campylobacterota bacterium]
MKEFIRRIEGITSLEEAQELLMEVVEEPSEQVLKALDFAKKAHEGQYRKSGDPYVIHPILVAAIVAHVAKDETMIVAALLHDVVEDTPYGIDEIQESFGEDVAHLVEGLTKIVEIRSEELPPSSSKESLVKAALSFRKMLLASIKDVRVLIVKLCDRLHNMLTLAPLPEAKRRRIAEETLVVYAPIAHRLGISTLKNVLEDLSFFYLFPEEYRKIDEYIRSHKQELQFKLNGFIQELRQHMVKNGFGANDFEIIGRIKHYYSIYLKMQRKGISIEEVLDLLAVRILVKEPLQCYQALGIVHTNYTPLIMRFKDYIALPKENGYKTIHTTVFAHSSIFEVQLRTFAMHKTAEYGIAAHWKYKLGYVDVNLKWLENLQYQQRDIEEFYELVKDDLFSEEIAVFTPKGDVITLPRGAVALDFAYAIHTDVGHRAKAAYINKIKQPLITELRNGDIVRIELADEPLYRCSWIDTLKTARAKEQMRLLCRQKYKEINAKAAVNILASELRIEPEEIERWLQEHGISRHRVATDLNYFKDVKSRILSEYRKQKSFLGFIGPRMKFEEKEREHFLFYTHYPLAAVEFDYCCHPKRGDEVVAFRDGTKAIIHHKMCQRAQQMIGQGHPMLFVQWKTHTIPRYKVLALLPDQKGALAKLLQFLLKLDINLVSIELGKNVEQSNLCEMTIESPRLDPEALQHKLRQQRVKIIQFIPCSDPYTK